MRTFKYLATITRIRCMVWFSIGFWLFEWCAKVANSRWKWIPIRFRSLEKLLKISWVPSHHLVEKLFGLLANENHIFRWICKPSFGFHVNKLGKLLALGILKPAVRNFSLLALANFHISVRCMVDHYYYKSLSARMPLS